MSSTDPISALATQSTAPSSTPSNDKLDQKAFLQLMIAQFKNQDPNKPQDPTQFLGQLAQFSTVSGIQDMQTSISSLSDSLRSSSLLNGASLVGHSILAPHDAKTFTSGEPMGGAVDVPAGVTSLKINVTDASGQLVRQFNVNAQQGLTDFAWDGLTDRGEAAAAGSYTFTAQANVGGKNESLPMLLDTRVDSVTIDPTTHGLVLNTSGMGAIPLTDVRRVM